VALPPLYKLKPERGRLGKGQYARVQKPACGHRVGGGNAGGFTFDFPESDARFCFGKEPAQGLARDRQRTGKELARNDKGRVKVAKKCAAFSARRTLPISRYVVLSR
jgi:hypothetical protein